MNLKEAKERMKFLRNRIKSYKEERNEISYNITMSENEIRNMP